MFGKFAQYQLLKHFLRGTDAVDTILKDTGNIVVVD